MDTTATALTSALTSAMNNIASDIIEVIPAIAAVALPVAGVIFVARRAMGWFKSMAK